MIFVTGDTHMPIDVQKLYTRNFPAQKGMTKDDFVIICGDFGGIWNDTKEEKYWLGWLHGKPFTTLFVDGNHENFDLLDTYPVDVWNGGNVRKISKSVYHLMRGQVFTIDNYKFFTMGGAHSVDKVYRKAFMNWWPQEMPSYAEFEEALKNLDKHGNKVDFIISHTAPLSIIQKFTHLHQEEIPLNHFLENVKSTTKFHKWYFGHHHLDIEINKKFRAIYQDVVKVTN